MGLGTSSELYDVDSILGLQLTTLEKATDFCLLESYRVIIINQIHADNLLVNNKTTEGLDGAGKTTILYRLQVGEVVTTIPTIGFNVETVVHKNLKFQVWDLGGQTSIRPYWRCYYSNTDAIIYVVDSMDRDRVGISKQELFSMLEEEELRGAVLVILANKQDISGCMSISEVAQSLGLAAIKNRRYQLFKTSALKGEGLEEAMDWLSNTLCGQK
ncbi:unnamed protein product [Trichobilharzia szidati]|nr:unnamed protein product [Trichobilharzia szidati]